MSNKQGTLLPEHSIHEVYMEITADRVVDESFLRFHLLSLVAEDHIVIPPTP